MKPAPQIDSNSRNLLGETGPTNHRAFPLTDYSFQPTSQSLRTGAAIAEKGRAELQTFRNVSREFFGAETRRDYVTEAFLFVSITCVAAWPMSVVIHQLTRWMI